MNPERSRTELVVVLGAGASVDAGLPDARSLSHEVFRRLREDVPGANRVLEQLALVAPGLEGDYELLFEWLFRTATARHFRALIGLGGEGDVFFAMVAAARRVISERVRTVTDLRLGAYLSELHELRCFCRSPRLKIFTLNYDTILEDVSRAAGIDVATGFAPATGIWTPEGFRSQLVGTNLYKLHSSVRWYPVRSPAGPDRSLVMELAEAPEERLPLLVLGPGPKPQSDDPFFYLLEQFHGAMKTAHTCVAIGYGWRDPHVTERIDAARVEGMRVLNVGLGPAPLEPGQGYGLSSHGRCHQITEQAREAIEGRLISEKVEELIRRTARDGELWDEELPV